MTKTQALAIKALEQQPSKDWYDIPSEEMTLEQARQAVKDLRKKLAEYLEQPSNDCISRAELLKKYEDRFIELQIVHQQDKQLGVNWCINTLKDMPPVTPIFSKSATNGDVVEKIFGKDVYCTLIRMMYSSCCEKLKCWWNAPYGRGSENGR